MCFINPASTQGKFRVLPWEACLLFREELAEEQSEEIGGQESAEGIVMRDQVKPFRHSRRKPEERISGTATRTHEGLNGSRKGINEESSHSHDEKG